MKLKNILVSLLASSMVLIGCTNEGRPVFDEIQINPSFIGIDPKGGEVEAELTAKAEWEITGLTENDAWLTVSQMNGAAGTFTIKFSAGAYDEGAREANLTIVCSGKEQKVVVRQSPGVVEAKVYTIAEVLAFTQADDGKTVAVKGTVARITGAQYGEFYIKDDNGNELLIYNSQPSFDEIQPSVGDIVTVQGPFTIYKGTYELNKGSKIIAIERSLIQLPKNNYILQSEGGLLDVGSILKGDGLQVNIEFSEDNSGWLVFNGTKPDGDSTRILFNCEPYQLKLAPRTATISLSTVNGSTVSEAQFTVTQYGVIPDLSTIADAMNADYAKVQGQVAAIHTSGYVLVDETDAILVYKPAGFSLDDCKIGDKMELVGNRVTYNYGPQIESPWYAEKLEEGTYEYPSAETFDASAINDLISSLSGKDKNTDIVVDVKYVSATGSLVIDGNYKNLKIEGVSEADMSLYNTPDSFNASEFGGKTVTVKGYITSVSGGSHVNIVVTSLEEAE